MKFVIGLVGLTMAADTPAWESCELAATKTCEFGYCCATNILRNPELDPAQTLPNAYFQKLCMPRIVNDGANTFVDNADADVDIADSTTAFYNTMAGRLQSIPCNTDPGPTCRAYSADVADNTYSYICGASSLAVSAAAAVAALLY